MKDYFENPATSRSELARLDTHPKVYKYPKESSGGDAFRLGSAFDHLMFFPETWNDEYFISNSSNPAGFMGGLVKEYVRLRLMETWESEEELFNAAYDHSGYTLARKTVKERFEKEPKEYAEEVIGNVGKIFISPEEAAMLDKMRIDLVTHDEAKKYFIPQEGEELHFQLPVYWDETVVVEGVDTVMPVKVLFDSVRVDHTNKVIYPSDLKTTGDSVYKFPHSFKFYKYYLQSSMYQAGIYHWKVTQPGLEYYEVAPFRFIVAEKACQNAPLIYKVSADDLAAGSTGYTNLFQKRINGWKNLLENLAWHEKYDTWDHPRDYSEEVTLHELL